MYIQNGDTTQASIVGPWVQLKRGIQGISFHVNIAATGSPIGTLNFDVSNDDDPRNGTTGAVLGAVPVTLAAPYSTTYQPSDGLARNVVFDFGDAPMPVGCPSAKWMRMRYVRTSGGSNAAGNFNADVHQRGI